MSDGRVEEGTSTCVIGGDADDDTLVRVDDVGLAPAETTIDLMAVEEEKRWRMKWLRRGMTLMISVERDYMRGGVSDGN